MHPFDTYGVSHLPPLNIGSHFVQHAAILAIIRLYLLKHPVDVSSQGARARAPRRRVIPRCQLPTRPSPCRRSTLTYFPAPPSLSYTFIMGHSYIFKLITASLYRNLQTHCPQLVIKVSVLVVDLQRTNRYGPD